jgi:integrase
VSPYWDVQRALRAQPTASSAESLSKAVEAAKPYRLPAELLKKQIAGKQKGSQLPSMAQAPWDRAVPLTRSILPELLAQLEQVKDLHEQDMHQGYAGVFLDNLLEKKYRNAPKELIWQWFFPAKNLTNVEGSHERRRYHLHESHVQKAIKAALRRAKLTKRVSSHSFRHSFATHLLQANYDIRTIQELLGHSDVKSTMIYTHTAPSRTLKEARSPLDF